MAIPKTGSRMISVDGVVYRWLIRRRPTYSQAAYGDGRVHVGVQLAFEPGSTLVIVTDRPHRHCWIRSSVMADSVPVTPSDVAFWIRKSIDLGWQPGVPGGQVWMGVQGGVVERGHG